MSNENLTEFKDRMKAARECRGLSKTALAKKLNVSDAYIGQLEAGKKDNPSDIFIRSLATELKVNSVWLKTGLGRMELEEPLVVEEEHAGWVKMSPLIRQVVEIMSCMSEEHQQEVLHQVVREYKIYQAEQKLPIEEKLLRSAEEAQRQKEKALKDLANGELPAEEPKEQLPVDGSLPMKKPTTLLEKDLK
ncbi:helix-turn-helix domain-containing protein [Geobacter pelophilus]|uniref:Helix-turn-helix domain-containing protein n=1 Tax=Geoanaerobacter pelophilus TaxID=60036 RepID=A0AAW4LEP2_9BACT|nr:helix-turn-helix transcriptional regulator [Geoanaerobacter pelophilus]MBT0666382.1 helix-turn-helix domain-containing protein [Geoanaerobacter pelophilus]